MCGLNQHCSCVVSTSACCCLESGLGCSGQRRTGLSWEALTPEGGAWRASHDAFGPAQPIPGGHCFACLDADHDCMHGATCGAHTLAAVLVHMLLHRFSYLTESYPLLLTCRYGSVDY